MQEQSEAVTSPVMVRLDVPLFWPKIPKGLMYKDKDRQREANREHARAYRSRKKGMTEGMTQGMTPAKGMTIPGEVVSAVDRFVEKARSGRPLVAHSPACRCLMCTGK